MDAAAVAPPLAAAAGLAAVHLMSQRLRVLGGIPRNRFLSIAGGMAVAFVFHRLLPSIADGQSTLTRATAGTLLGVIERHVFVVTLLSLLMFYALEHAARVSKRQPQEQSGEERTSHQIFWLHIATFGVMNALIGYLLIDDREQSILAQPLFFIAMMLTFVVNDHALHRDHKERYDNVGRYVLASAVFLGVATRLLVKLPDLAPVLLQAALAGAVLLNVLKEELPSERRARVGAFFGGALAYAVLFWRSSRSPARAVRRAASARRSGARGDS